MQMTSTEMRNIFSLLANFGHRDLFNDCFVRFVIHMPAQTFGMLKQFDTCVQGMTILFYFFNIPYLSIPNHS